MSLGNLYYYFDSKEAIVGAMAEMWLAEIGTIFSRTTTEGSNPLVVLIDMVERASARVESASFIFDMMAEAARNPALGKILEAHHHVLRTGLTAYVRDAQKAG